MARPRKAERRVHQINLRFTAPELIRIHQNAAITGKVLTDFGRAVLLRRPRKRRRGTAPAIIAWPDEMLAAWHELGTRLNDLAYLMNARDDLPPRALGPLLAELRGLLKKSLPSLFAPDTALAPYSLAPPVRHHLRKVGVNLTQIKTRHDRQGFEIPLALVRLLERIRAILNGDQSPA